MRECSDAGAGRVELAEAGITHALHDVTQRRLDKALRVVEGRPAANWVGGRCTVAVVCLVCSSGGSVGGF